MTTLQQAIANLQRTEANSGYPDVDHFCQALDFCPMGWNETFSARCKSYWLERWMCTDTMVGTAVVYVDDTPVALFVQTGRKSTPYIRFIGEEGAEVMRKLLASLQSKGHYDVCDVHARIPDFSDYSKYPQYAKQAL